MRALVLDSALNPVPDGVPGALHLAGSGLARGYLDDPAKTAQAFAPNPHGPAGSRLYATGDRARILDSGALEFLGRLDAQIKLRGFRIEPGEIENLLCSHTAVDQAVVLARQDGHHHTRLDAYLRGRTTRVEELRRHLQQWLPDVMIPTTFTWLDQFPTNANNKIDRAALPEPTPEPSRPGQPRDGLDLRLTRIWSQILDRPVGPDADFFQNGGHSLATVRLATALEHHLARPIPVAAIFGAPTPARFADWLRATATNYQPQTLIPLQSNGQAPPLILIHPIGGNIICYGELARALTDIRPVYALQAPALDDPSLKPATQVPEIAAQYWQIVHQHQPAGPYSFGGWSFGGWIALELSRLALAQGHAVAAPILIDSDLPGRVTAKPDPQTLRQAFTQDLKAQGIPDPGPHLERCWTVFQHHEQAATTYRPGPYPGPVQLILAQQGPAPDQRAQGWRRLTRGQFSLHHLPGDHYQLLRQPTVGQLAQIVSPSPKSPEEEP
jgi:thioesterase domain-containing protein